MSDKETVLERLSKRDAQRIEHIEKQHIAKSQQNATHEQVEYFNNLFKEKSDKIENALSTISTLDPTTLPEFFDNIKKETIDLQKYVVTSSIFLKEFNMRKCLSVVQNFQTQCYELEEKLVPRKRFGFNRKKTSKTDIEKKPEKKDVIDGNIVSCNKWENELFGFDSHENEYLFMGPDEVEQKDVSLRNLKNCTVVLKGVLATLHINNITNCTILCGPVSTSVFLDKCTESKVVVACQQLRMHSSTDCDIYLHVTSKGIIEDCYNIRTAPYNFLYDDINIHFKKACLERKVNNWNDLDDFNWLATGISSPNWSTLEESKKVTDWSLWFNKLSK